MTMFDLLKKTMYTGVGLAVLTKEKLVDFGKEVARQAELSETQAKEFQDELQKKAEEARNDLQAEIDRRVEAALNKFGLVRSEQFRTLTERVEALEKQLAESRGQ